MEEENRDSAIEAKMRQEWDERARDNARYYVATQQDHWTDEEFFASGQEEVRNQILNDMINVCGGKDPKQMTVLEIGCGAGRVTRALAEVFGEVHAVDVSGEMVRQAREACGSLDNVRIEQNNGRDLTVLGNVKFDFAFSSIVFQHIPSKDVIESYVNEVHRVLRHGRLFKFQVQGDPTIERADNDTWLGVAYSEDEVIDLGLRCGFEPRHRIGAGTQYFWLWYFKKFRAMQRIRYVSRRFSQYCRMRWETARRSF